MKMPATLEQLCAVLGRFTLRHEHGDGGVMDGFHSVDGHIRQRRGGQTRFNIAPRLLDASSLGAWGSCRMEYCSQTVRRLIPGRMGFLTAKTTLASPSVMAASIRQSSWWWRAMWSPWPLGRPRLPVSARGRLPTTLTMATATARVPRVRR
jgi:hypothetical protein